MSRPLRIRIMPRTARLATRYAPVRLVSSTAAKSSSFISASSWSRVTPALATSTSTGPWSCSTAPNAASTLAESCTSQRTTASPSTGSPEREVTVTLSPPAASRRPMASPIPRFPPVTSTERVPALPSRKFKEMVPVKESGVTVSRTSTVLTEQRRRGHRRGDLECAAALGRNYGLFGPKAGDLSPGVNHWRC